MKAIESRFVKLVSYPFLFIVFATSSVFIYIASVLAVKNLSKLITFEILPGVLFFFLLGLTFPIILAINKFEIEFKNDHLRLRYLFGIITKSYHYSNVQFNDIRRNSEAITIIQLRNKEQLPFTDRLYANYEDLKALIHQKIAINEEIYWNPTFSRPNKIFAIIAFVIAVTFIISMLTQNAPS